MRDSKSAFKARAQRNFVNLPATCASVSEETMEHHRDSFITLNLRLLLATSVCRIKNLAHAPQEKQDKWNIYEKCKKRSNFTFPLWLLPFVNDWLYTVDPLSSQMTQKRSGITYHIIYHIKNRLRSILILILKLFVNVMGQKGSLYCIHETQTSYTGEVFNLSDFWYMGIFFSFSSSEMSWILRFYVRIPMRWAAADPCLCSHTLFIIWVNPNVPLSYYTWHILPKDPKTMSFCTLEAHHAPGLLCYLQVIWLSKTI